MQQFRIGGKELNHIKHEIASQMSKKQADTWIKDSSEDITNQNWKHRNHSILKTQLDLHYMLHHKEPWKKDDKESRIKNQAKTSRPMMDETKSNQPKKQESSKSQKLVAESR